MHRVAPTLVRVSFCSSLGLAAASEPDAAVFVAVASEVSPFEVASEPAAASVAVVAAVAPFEVATVSAGAAVASATVGDAVVAIAAA